MKRPNGRNRTRARWLIGVLLAVGVAFVGCGADRPAATDNGAAPPLSSERCTSPGAVRDCHAIVSEADGVRTCAVGKQTCTAAGYWSSCSTEGVHGPALLQSLHVGLQNNGIGIRALSPAVDGGIACSPCDPDCMGYNEICPSLDGGADGGDAGDAGDAGCVVTPPPVPIPFVGTPGAVPGFENKVLADQCNNNGGGNPSARACEVGPYGSNSSDVNGGRMASTCQADHYCEPTAGLAGPGCCKRFDPNQTHATAASGGLTCTSALPDLTLAGGCAYGTGASADLVLTICNRGDATATGPIWVGATNAAASVPPHNGGTAASPTCYSLAAGDYTCRYDGSIPPGKCANISKNSALGAGCGGSLATGNLILMVNGPNAPALISECELDVKNTVNATQPNQPGCANNLTAFNTNTLPSCGGFSQITFSQTYTATCTTGQRPKWTTLGWDGLTPSSGGQKSSIEFRATVQDVSPDGGVASSAGPQLVGVALNGPSAATYVEGPASCRPDVPTASPECPKNFSKTIGAPPPTGSGPLVLNYSQLRLDITLKPSAKGALAPTLTNWWVAYTCVDSE